MQELLKDNSLKAVTFFCAIECIFVILTVLCYIIIPQENRSTVFSMPLLAAIIIFPISRIYSILQTLHILWVNKGVTDSKTTKSIVYIVTVNLCVILTYWLFTSVL